MRDAVQPRHKQAAGGRGMEGGGGRGLRREEGGGGAEVFHNLDANKLEANGR